MREVSQRDLFEWELGVRYVVFLGQFKGWNKGVRGIVNLDVSALRVGALHIEQ